MNIIAPHHLPWNCADSYWVVIEGKSLSKDMMEAISFDKIAPNLYAAHTEKSWGPAWERLEQTIQEFALMETTRVAVIASDKLPPLEEIKLDLRPYEDAADLADNLWLGDALLEDRVTCYLQPVKNKEGSIFGYEAFARIEQSDGTTTAGGAIIAASRALKIEYRVDRLLHHKAMEAYIKGGLKGVLFINFLPGFIHRPEIYLKGLTKEVEEYGVTPQNIVLDLTQSEMQRNTEHLKSIYEYCKKQGFTIALDNVSSLRKAEELMNNIQPKFIKLDKSLTHDITSAPTAVYVKQLIELAHHKGITVIGEMIETEEVYRALHETGVDLFQGFYIGRPERQTAK